MNRRVRGAVAALILGISGAWLITPAGAESSSVTITHATVTAAKVNGQSAVVLLFHNASSGPITILSVESPVAKDDMIFYDTNMCQGNHAMAQLANIFVTSGNTQKLGYQFQGAMIWKLSKPLTKGEKIPLKVTWSNFHGSHTTTVEAKVVKAPPSINFAMSSMKM
ncbi:MAG: copper chaperone PCu(A)C [Acidimicrobiales bacterium]